MNVSYTALSDAFVKKQIFQVNLELQFKEEEAEK